MVAKHKDVSVRSFSMVLMNPAYQGQDSELT